MGESFSVKGLPNFRIHLVGNQCAEKADVCQANTVGFHVLWRERKWVGGRADDSVANKTTVACVWDGRKGKWWPRLCGSWAKAVWEVRKASVLVLRHQ